MESRGTAMDQEGQYTGSRLSTMPAQLLDPQTSDSDTIELKNVANDNNADLAEPDHAESPWKPDYRFWCILASLGIGVTMAGVENTIIVTALPFIIEDLGNGKTYVWIANVHFLTG